MQRSDRKHIKVKKHETVRAEGSQKKGRSGHAEGAASFCIPECDETKRSKGRRDAKWPLTGSCGTKRKRINTEDTVKRDKKGETGNMHQQQSEK